MNPVRTDGYFDIEVDIDDVENQCSCGLDDALYLKDLQNRKLFINTEISQLSISVIVKYILQYNADDRGKEVSERKPILLYIVSNGGEIDSGFELIDAIRASITPVYTINLGYWYSMGFLIGISGHKRYAMPSARFLIHDGDDFIYNSSTKAQDQMEFIIKMNERIKELVLEESRISSEEYDSKRRVEWYMFADEAKERGFIDCIVGVDCTMDEIV